MIDARPLVGAGVVEARAAFRTRAPVVGTPVVLAPVAHVVEHVLGRRQARAVQSNQGGGHRLGRPVGQQSAGELQFLGRGGFVQQRVFQQPDLIAGADFLGQRRAGPFDVEVGHLEQALGGPALGVGHNDDRDALLARATRTAAPVQEAGGVGRQVGVDHQAEVGQVEATGRHVGGDAGAGMAVTQGLQRVRALLLRQFAGKLHGREAAFAQGAVQVADPLASGAEDQGAGAFEIAQQVHHRVLDLVRGHAHGPVFDVAVGLVAADGVDAHRVALIALGQGGDVLGDGGGEQESAALGRGRIEDFLEVLAEAHVEHLVGLVEDDDLEAPEVEVAPLQVVAQAAGRAHDDVAAGGERPLLLPRVHAADAGHHPRPGCGVKPRQLAADLQRQFAGGGDGQAERGLGPVESLGLAQHGNRGRQPEGHGLARSRLRRDQQVAILRRLQHRRLDGGRLTVALRLKRFGQGGVGGGKRHMQGSGAATAPGIRSLYGIVGAYATGRGASDGTRTRDLRRDRPAL